MSTELISTDKPEKTALVGRGTLWVVLPPLFIALISGLGLGFSYLVFHTAAELFSIVIALAALLVASVSHRFRKNDFLVYMAIVIGWCAIIDLWHTMAYKGMGLLPGDNANPPTQLWIAARYLQALGMITAPLFLYRQLQVWMAHVAFGSGDLLLMAAIAYGVFPDAYIDGRGLTPFKIFSEYLIILMLAFALFQLWHGRAMMARQMLLALSVALVAMMLSEFAFTRYASVYAVANLVGHVFKIMAYWFIFIALVEWTLTEPFMQLKESESRMSAIVRGSPMGITLLRSPDTVIVDANEAAERILGFSREEIVGHTAVDLRIFPHPAQRDEALRLLRERGRVDQFQVDFRTKTGEARVMSYSGRTVTIQGHPHIMGIWHDITDRVRVEERLRESEERFRQLFENNASVLLVIEPESGAIVDANAAAARYYGYPVDVLKSMRIDDINTLGAAETAAERHRAVQEERNYFIFPHRLASGEVRTVEVRSSPISLQGRTLLFSIVTDVTAGRLAEAALRERTAEIMARNEELTRFSRVAVDRELRMIKLKREVNALCARLGEPPPYESADKV